MVIILKPEISQEQIDNLTFYLRSCNLNVMRCDTSNQTVLCVLGDSYTINTELITQNEIVERVEQSDTPFLHCGRSNHPDNTVIDIQENKIGGGDFLFMAGPCCIESKNQLLGTAKSVKESGAQILRGGAFKPRSSPYSFQGMGEMGLKILLEVKKELNMPVVTEIMNINHLDLFENVDIIQVGARNMQNFELLRELGHTKKTILLKRGLSATLHELLMSAEYIMAGGNGNIILCERGIRTFETATRNTLDISAIPLLKEMTHLPVIVDPSHASGNPKLVKPLSMASAACGADGLLIEVHNNPSQALCDSFQAITPEMFKNTRQCVSKLLSSISE